MKKDEIDLKQATEVMDELKREQARLKFELKNVEEDMGKWQLILEAALKQTNVDYMTFGIYSFGWKPTTRRCFNQKQFGEDHPDLLEQYKTEVTNSKFEFKVGV